jgi:hypothetical protein
VQRPSPGLGRDFGVAKPAPGRGQYPFRRRLGPLHQERDPSHDVGPARLNQWWRSDRLGSVLILAWVSFVRFRSHAEGPQYLAGISRRS